VKRLSEAELTWLAIPVAMPAPGRTQAFRVRGQALLLCNVDGTPYVLRDECSHARTQLAGGRLCGFVLECPLHGGKLDVRDGSPVAPPIRRSVASFPVRRDGDRLELGLPPPRATPPPHP
jgi:naphthalene 1,2-dioxygenase system ferredoxin subunit